MSGGMLLYFAEFSRTESDRLARYAVHQVTASTSTNLGIKW
jgi:hypothetical protein